MIKPSSLMRPAAAAFALSALVALSACGGKEHAAPKAEAPSGERITVQAAPVQDMKPVAAMVATADTADARARIGGVLTSLLVDEGVQVTRGQRIATVVDDRIGLQTRALDAQAAAYEAEAVRAAKDLERTRILVERGVYAQARLDQDQATADAARKQADAARAQSAANSEAAAQGAILAPASGKVTWAGVPAGSVVSPGQSVATIAAGAPLVRIELPEAEAAALKVGDAVAIDGAANGQVIEIYPAIKAGRVVADIRVPGLDGALVGRRLTAHVPVGQRTAIVIPARYVSTRFGVDYVKVLGHDDTAADIPVQLAPGPDAASREVLSGLAEGDVIFPPAAGQ